MNPIHRTCIAIMSAVTLGLGGAACDKLELGKPVSFSADIKPLLETRCINCHHAGALFGDLNLENHDLAFKPRARGPVITPGSSAKSPLYLVLTLPEGDKKAMPPTGHRISAAETDLIKRWIDQGATWPKGPEGVVKPMAARDPKGV